MKTRAPSPGTPESDDSVMVIDFETTGLSPANGDRTIEIGAVLIHGGRIADRFQSLMNPGKRINSFIQDYTGISNAMLKKAPAVEEVMQKLAVFMARHPIVAHNAGFDLRFLDAELARIHLLRKQTFACSMLISRRIFPDAPNHRLETLVRYRALRTDGVFHRALADAEMTAHLWIDMIDELKNLYHFSNVPFELMQCIAKVPKASAPDYLSHYAKHLTGSGMAGANL